MAFHGILVMSPYHLLGVLVDVFIVFCREKPCNQTVYTDQTMRSVASEFSLHLLHISPKRVSSLEKVKRV